MGAGVKAAEHGRYTTPTDDVRRRHGLLPPRRGLIYRIMMAHGGVPHSHGELIHRSAWNRNSRKFAVAISGLRRPKEGHPIATWSGPRRYPGRFATNRARKRSNLLRLATGRLSENFGVWRTSPLRSSKKFALRG